MFHLPNDARIRNGPLASTEADGHNGACWFAGIVPGRALWVIASDGMGWEHVSLHAANRTNKLFMPTWSEMCWVKAQFWDPEDVVMQLHPAASEYVNTHDYTLHLWRPIGQMIPTPPSLLVGLKIHLTKESTP